MGLRKRLQQLLQRLNCEEDESEKVEVVSAGFGKLGSLLLPCGREFYF